MCAAEWSSRCRKVESSAVSRSGLAIDRRFSLLQGPASTTRAKYRAASTKAAGR